MNNVNASPFKLIGCDLNSVAKDHVEKPLTRKERIISTTAYLVLAFRAKVVRSKEAIALWNAYKSEKAFHEMEVGLKQGPLVKHDKIFKFRQEFLEIGQVIDVKKDFTIPEIECFLQGVEWMNNQSEADEKANANIFNRLFPKSHLNNEDMKKFREMYASKFEELNELFKSYRAAIVEYQAHPDFKSTFKGLSEDSPIKTAYHNLIEKVDALIVSNPSLAQKLYPTHQFPNASLLKTASS